MSEEDKHFADMEYKRFIDSLMVLNITPWQINTIEKILIEFSLMTVTLRKIEERLSTLENK